MEHRKKSRAKSIKPTEHHVVDTPYSKALRQLQRRHNYHELLQHGVTMPTSTEGGAPHPDSDSDDGLPALSGAPIPPTLRKQLEHLQRSIAMKLNMAVSVPIKETMRLLFETRTMVDKLLKDIPTYKDFNENMDASKVSEMYNEFRKVPIMLPKVEYTYSEKGMVEVEMSERVDMPPAPIPMTPAPPRLKAAVIMSVQQVAVAVRPRAYHPDVRVAAQLASIYTSKVVVHMDTQTDLTAAMELFKAHQTNSELAAARRTIRDLETDLVAAEGRYVTLEADCYVLTGKLGRRCAMAQYIREMIHKERNTLTIQMNQAKRGKTIKPEEISDIHSILDVVLLCFDSGDTATLDEFVKLTGREQALRVKNLEHALDVAKIEGREKSQALIQQRNEQRAKMDHAVKRKNAEISVIRGATNMHSLENEITAHIRNLRKKHSKDTLDIKKLLSTFKTELAKIKDEYDEMRKQVLAEVQGLHQVRNTSKSLQDLFEFFTANVEAMMNPEYVLLGHSVQEHRMKDQMIHFANSKIGADASSLVINDIEHFQKLQRKIHRFVMATYVKPEASRPQYGRTTIEICKQLLAYARNVPDGGSEAIVAGAVEGLEVEYTASFLMAQYNFLLVVLTLSKKLRLGRCQGALKAIGAAASVPLPVRHTVGRIDDAIRHIQRQKVVYESARADNAKRVYGLWKEASNHMGAVPAWRKTLKDLSVLPAVACHTLRQMENIPKVQEPTVLVEMRKRGRAKGKAVANTAGSNRSSVAET